MVGETRKSLICLVGMGAFCAMFRAPFFGTLTMGVPSGLSGLRVTYDTAIIILGCLLALVSLWRSKGRAIGFQDASAHIPLVCVGSLAVVGVLAMSISRMLGIGYDAYYIVGILVFSVGFSALAIAWFYVLVRLPRDKIASLVMGAFVISHVFGIIDLLPREWALALSVLYPLLALWTATVLRKMLPVHPDAEQKLHLQSAYLRNVQVFTIMLVFAELVCGSFLRARWAHGGVNYMPHPYVVYSYLNSICVGIVFWLVSRRSKATAECTLVIGGIALVGFMVATLLFIAAPTFPIAPFITGLHSALLVYSMALISLWGLDGGHRASACAAFFLVVFGLVSGVTTSIVPAVLSFYQVTPAEILFPMGVAAGLVISLGMCAALFVMVIFHRELFLNKLERGTDGDVKEAEHALTSEERHERAMHAVADRYALTEREEQTASLLARGYTAKHVADEMGVAVSTVKGYSKTIYTKMGIHRKDELNEIVKAAKDRV